MFSQFTRFAASSLLLLGTQTRHATAQDTRPGGPVHDGQPDNCSGWHTIVSGDTCATIPKRYAISRDQFLKWNPAVSEDCTQNFSLGNAYCVRVKSTSPDQGDTNPGGPVHEGQPDNCNAWHTVAEGDTCATVPNKYGISREQFEKWNLAVSEDCTQNFWLGNAYCVGIGSRPTTSSSRVTSMTSTSKPTITTTSVNMTYSTRHSITTWNITVPTIGTAWPPTATQPGQPAGCNRWHYVVAGSTCQSVMNKYGRFMTKEQLHEWNPELHEDCSGLYADTWICVSVRGIWPDPDLGWSTSTPDFTSPPPPSSHHPTVFPTVDSSFTPVPSQGPIPDNCKNYHQVESGETCNTILDIYGYITREQFFEWNPVLEGNCGGLWVGNWYCVSAFDGDKPLPPTVTATPSPIPSGSPGNCKSWYYTTIDDTCDLISAMFGTFSSKDFISWNPSVFEDCTDIKQHTWYCVGKANTPTTRTTGIPTPTYPGEGMPTESGIADDCNNYWMVSPSDTCDSIAAANGITTVNLKVWNRALGPQCDGLKPDFYICVGIGSHQPTPLPPTGTKPPTTSPKPTNSATSTTSGTQPIETPSPVREGMTSQCRRFYLMQAGDLCWSMAQSAGITIDQFIEWNPVVGKECGGLWPDYYYCIGVAGPVTTITSGASGAYIIAVFRYINGVL